MDHKPYRRIVACADTAILFVHGIVGTPDHFDPLITLVPECVSIWNLLLDGHGKTPSDFSRTSMKYWEFQVASAVAELAASHTHICIVAHSMGTLLAIEQAIRHKSVKGIFLMAVPICIGPKPRMFSNAFKVYSGWIRPEDPFGMAAKAACSISPSKNPFSYLGWIPRYLELFQKIKKTRSLLPQLNTPGIAFQSTLDEMVSVKAAEYLRSHSNMKVISLNDSYHYLYSPADLEQIISAFQTFLKNIKETVSLK